MLKPSASSVEFYKTNFDRHGFTVALDVAPFAGNWLGLISSASISPRLVELKEKQRLHCSGRGDARSFIYDRFQTDGILPSMNHFYKKIRALASEVTGRSLVISPFERSAYSVKIYEPETCEMGWHLDTNSITVLLYVTTNVGGQTEIRCLDGVVREVKPVAGNLLIMDGTLCEHRAAKVDSARKIVCLLNYYNEGEYQRDLAMDKLAFGLSSSETDAGA